MLYVVFSAFPTHVTLLSAISRSQPNGSLPSLRHPAGPSTNPLPLPALHSLQPTNPIKSSLVYYSCAALVVLCYSQTLQAFLLLVAAGGCWWLLVAAGGCRWLPIQPTLLFLTHSLTPLRFFRLTIQAPTSLAILFCPF
jgi:hypothetical protein